MFGVGRGITFALVGWLWADLLLGAFAIFLAANSAGATIPQPQRTQLAIDPKPIELAVDVEGPDLLFGTPEVIEREQRRVTDEITRRLSEAAPGRRVAIVLAFGAHESPTLGDRLAKAATEQLRSGQFEGSVVKIFHELRAGDPGRSLALEVYLYE